MADHIVTSFDADLKLLKTRLAEMGGMVEEMLTDSVEALAVLNRQAAEEVVERDKKIDALQKEIDEACIRTIALRQPMGSDLRVIVSSIRLSTDLERMGDLSKGIARRCLDIDDQMPPAQLMHRIKRMAELTNMQVSQVLDAFAAGNDRTALTVWHQDNQIDDLYTSLFREFLTYMMEDPRKISICTHMLFCAKNLERIGDHATNIAENVIYQVTGQTFDAYRAASEDGSSSSAPTEAAQ